MLQWRGHCMPTKKLCRLLPRWQQPRALCSGPCTVLTALFPVTGKLLFESPVTSILCLALNARAAYKRQRQRRLLWEAVQCLCHAPRWTGCPRRLTCTCMYSLSYGVRTHMQMPAALSISKPEQCCLQARCTYTAYTHCHSCDATS